MSRILINETRILGDALTDDPEFIDIRIVEVPTNKGHPRGIKYAINYRIGDIPIIRYDNHERKKGHRHIFPRDEEKSCPFTSIAEIQKELLELRWKLKNEIIGYVREVRRNEGK